MTDRSGALERVGPPVAQPQPPGAVAFRAMGVLKAFIPWAIVIAIWETAAANGWSGAVLFPPPSSFLRYAIASDFRVRFGGDALPIPFPIVVRALRALAGPAIGFAAALATGILISPAAAFADLVRP